MQKVSSRKKAIRVPQKGFGKVPGGPKAAVTQATVSGIGIGEVFGKLKHKEIGW